MHIKYEELPACTWYFPVGNALDLDHHLLSDSVEEKNLLFNGKNAVAIVDMLNQNCWVH
jgi:hypothetical protein